MLDRGEGVAPVSGDVPHPPVSGGENVSLWSDVTRYSRLIGVV